MRLRKDGDPDERRYWDAFVADRFPSYEAFWLAHVVPLTGRQLNPPHLHFRSRAELGRDRDEDVTIAQLHYTTLGHLGRVYDLLHPPAPYLPPAIALPEPSFGSATIQAASATDSFPTGYAEPPTPEAAPDFDPHTFTEAFVRLAAASDVADELLQRHACPGEYPAWIEDAGARARRHWRETDGDPLKPLRDYRNRLVHGRVVPSFVGRRRSYPRVGKVDDYLDWRNAIDASPSVLVGDFDDGWTIVSEAWRETVDYTESRWREHLLAGRSQP